MTFELQYTDSKTNARAGKRRAFDRVERRYKGADNIR